MYDDLSTHSSELKLLQIENFTGQNGKLCLATHGNQLDRVAMSAKWRAPWGDRAYVPLLWVNPKINRIRSAWSGCSGPCRIELSGGS